MLNDDALQVQELVSIELPTAMRGYRQEDVDALLDRVADALEERDALLRTMTEDRDALLVELQQAQRERDEAVSGIEQGGERARQAVDEARRLRERVQSRAEALLDDAGRRADELRAQGRAEAAVHVADGQAHARAIVADAERRRDQHERELRQRWQAVERDLEGATRRSERARTRLREELERHLVALDDWDRAAAPAALESSVTQPEPTATIDARPPVFPMGVRDDEDPDDEAGDAGVGAQELAQVIGWEPDDLADLDAPFRLGPDQDDRTT